MEKEVILKVGQPLHDPVEINPGMLFFDDKRNKIGMVLYKRQGDAIEMSEDTGNRIWHWNGEVGIQNPAVLYLVSSEQPKPGEKYFLGCMTYTRAEGYDLLYDKCQHNCFKVIVGPEHIGCPIGYDKYKWIQDIQKILDRGGDCKIELIREPVFKPVLVDGLGLAYDATESQVGIILNGGKVNIIL